MTFHSRRRISIPALRSIIEMYQLMLKEGKISRNGKSHDRLRYLRFLLSTRTKVKTKKTYKDLKSWIINHRNEETT